MNNFVIFFAACLLSGCAAKKITEDFDKNIDNFNSFYHSGAQDSEQQLLIYPADRPAIPGCNRANIKTNDITLKELARLLSKLYDANISYSSNMDSNEITQPANITAFTQVVTSRVAGKESASKKEEVITKDLPPPLQAPSNRIHLSMNDVCLEDIFDSLTETYDIGVDKLSYGYTIYPKQLKTETFSVDYHNFYRTGRSSISIVNSQLKSQDNSAGGGAGSGSQSDNFSSISTESTETFWMSITKTIRSILSGNKGGKSGGAGAGANSSSSTTTTYSNGVIPNSYATPTNSTATSTSTPTANTAEAEEGGEDFYVYRESGLIVVTAYPKQLKYIRKFLSKVNHNSTRQVLIEAKILEVELNDEFSNGIQWDALRKNLNYSSFTAVGSKLRDIYEIHSTQNLGTEGDLLSTPISGKVPRNRNFNIVMQALSSQGKISVISSPRILVLNNQRALIKSGEDKYFVTNVSNVTLDSSNANSASASKSGFDLEPFFSGIALDTTPNIINSAELLLHIHPMISRVEDENKLITIDNKDTKIPVAMIQSREADTVVKALSGDIIILGGMTQSFVQLRESGLPVRPKGGLSKVTDLLSAKKHLSKKVELIILIKPTIINSFDNREDIGTFTL